MMSPPIVSSCKEREIQIDDVNLRYFFVKSIHIINQNADDSNLNLNVARLKFLREIIFYIP